MVVDWGSPADQADIRRKVAACQRLLGVVKDLPGRHLPLRAHVSGPPPPETKVMPLAVFGEFGRATKAYDACILLAAAGFGQPAEVIATVVAESSFIVIWGTDRGERIDHLADLHARYGLQLEAEAWQSQGRADFLPEKPYLTEAERAEAARLFGATAGGLWTGHLSTADLMDEVISAEEDAFIRQQLKRLQVELRAQAAMRSATGAAQASHRHIVDPGGDPLTLAVNLGPGPEGVSNALHLASAAFLAATDTVVTAFAPDLADEVSAAEAFLWRAWKDPKVLAALADTDPCPCDKPDTLWGTCHKWTERLGTVAYVPFTDADLVNFTPSEPKTTPRPRRDMLPPSVPSDYPEGPHVVTFTFALPFKLGLEGGPGPTLLLSDTWADANDIGNFGSTPTVRIRLHNDFLPTESMWLGDPTRALQGFYGDTTDSSLEVSLPPVRSYEQWVTLETPGARLKSEAVSDPAYAFHRSLSALNLFLAAMDLAVSDVRIATISTHELGPVVFRGAWTQAGTWVRLGDLIMHPDSLPFSGTPVPFASVATQVDSAFHDLVGGRPFIISNLWHGRALRALRLRGDTADAIASLQTAAESMLYDLLRALMVDEGRASADIAATTSSDRPFKSLLTQVLPRRVGGNWSLATQSTRRGTVSRYWTSVYLLRNRVVHTGYTPSPAEADEAEETFVALREFVSQRLWACWPRYPRTLFAKVGVNGLERRGWATKRVREELARLSSEARPFYWPADIAGR